MRLDARELLAAANEQTLVGIAAAAQIPPHHLVEPVDDQDQSLAPRFPELDVGQAKKVVDRFQKARALLLDRRPQLGTGIGPVLDLYSQRQVRYVDISPSEAHFRSKSTAQLVPKVLQLHRGGRESGDSRLAKLPLDLAGQEHQEVREIQVVQVEHPGHVREQNVVGILLSRIRTFQHVLEPQKLTAFSDASVPGEDLHLRPQGVRKPQAALVAQRQVFAPNLIAVDIPRIIRRDRVIRLTGAVEPCQRRKGAEGRHGPKIDNCGKGVKGAASSLPPARLPAVPRLFILLPPDLLLFGLSSGATAAPSTIDVQSYSLDLEVRPVEKSIMGEVEIRFASRVEGLSEVALDAPGLTVESVRSGDRALAFRSEDDHLRVLLDPPARLGEERGVWIAYSGQPKRGLRFGADQVFTAFHTSRWMVCEDDPGDKA